MTPVCRVSDADEGLDITVAVILAVLFVHESRTPGRARYDIPGAITVTGGLFFLVYGITQAESAGWGSITTIGFLALAALLLVAFVVIEARTTLGSPTLGSPTLGSPRLRPIGSICS